MPASSDVMSRRQKLSRLISPRHGKVLRFWESVAVMFEMYVKEYFAVLRVTTNIKNLYSPRACEKPQSSV